MTHPVLAVAAAAAGLLVSSVMASDGQQPPPKERASEARAITLYVSAVDEKGAPVPTLAPEDLSVREDNVAREVLKVAPATEPLHIALLVDDSDAAVGAIPYIRDGVREFADALAGKAQIALITVGERPTQIVPYTASADRLKQGIGRLFGRTGSGAYLTEAIRDAARGLGRREGPRRAIVALTIEGVEFSTLIASQVLEDLERSGATLHVIGLGTTNARLDDEMRNRNTVLVEGSDRTGGRRDTIVSPLAIPERMRQLAAELASQYAVTYARPDTLIPPDRLSVSARRPGLTVRAPQKAPAAPQ